MHAGEPGLLMVGWAPDIGGASTGGDGGGRTGGVYGMTALGLTQQQSLLRKELLLRRPEVGDLQTQGVDARHESVDGRVAGGVDLSDDVLGQHAHEVVHLGEGDRPHRRGGGVGRLPVRPSTSERKTIGT